MLRDLQLGQGGELWAVGGHRWLRRGVEMDEGWGWVSALPPGTSPTALPAVARFVVSPSGADPRGSRWRPVVVDCVRPQRPEPRAAERLPRDVVVRADGAVLVLGVPVLWLGPFLTVPDLSAPKDVVSASAVTLEWAYAPGPDATMTRVHLNGMGFPFWWLYVNPNTTSVQLPDFNALTALTTLPTLDVSYAARVDRIFAPEMTINAFATYDVEGGDWRSWSTNGKLFTVHPSRSAAQPGDPREAVETPDPERRRSGRRVRQRQRVARRDDLWRLKSPASTGAFINAVTTQRVLDQQPGQRLSNSLCTAQGALRGLWEQVIDDDRDVLWTDRVAAPGLIDALMSYRVAERIKMGLSEDLTRVDVLGAGAMETAQAVFGRDLGLDVYATARFEWRSRSPFGAWRRTRRLRRRDHPASSTASPLWQESLWRRERALDASRPSRCCAWDGQPRLSTDLSRPP